MIVKKHITSTIDIDIDIEGVTLLSEDEYKECIDIIPPIHDWWWLRSPGYRPDYAASVNCGGSVRSYGYNVNIDSNAVRPALKINRNSLILLIGDKIELAGYMWTVISDKYILCDEAVAHIAFNNSSSKGNDYEKSDIKRWLENWAFEKGIIKED